MRIAASSSGRATGKLRSRTASSNWKMAVFAPIPKASDRMATVVNPTLCANTRTAYRTSCHTLSTMADTSGR